MLAVCSATYWPTEVYLPLFFFFKFLSSLLFFEADSGKLAYQLKYLNYKTTKKTLMRMF